MTLRNVSMRADRRAAFTLMEVLVVVAILVVLAGVGGVIFLRQQEDAYRNVARVQVKELTSACQSYALAHGGELPESLIELAQPPDGGRSYVEPKVLTDPWGRPYMYQREGSQGTNAQAGKPDIWSTGPTGAEQLGNWN
jgi:general secretion pathway protein G